MEAFKWWFNKAPGLNAQPQGRSTKAKNDAHILIILDVKPEVTAVVVLRREAKVIIPYGLHKSLISHHFVEIIIAEGIANFKVISR